MRKIRLDVDRLAVETFDTAGEKGRRPGTVRAHDASWPDCVSSPSGCPTCEQGCHQDTLTCFASCSTDHRPCIEFNC